MGTVRPPVRYVPLRVLACVLCGCAGLACISSALAQEALEVPNASFETLDPDTSRPAGWTAWADPNYAVFTLADARTGVACVAITDDSPTVSQGLRSPRIPIEAGAAYEARGWVKIERAENAGFAIYLEFWQGPTRLANKAISTPRAADWTELAVRLDAPEGATEATVLVYGGSVAVGRAYFDDLSLRRLAAE